MSDSQKIPNLHELDQSIATIVEMFPIMWWGLYNGCVKQGFTEYQALELVKAYITTVTPPQNPS